MHSPHGGMGATLSHLPRALLNVAMGGQAIDALHESVILLV